MYFLNRKEAGQKLAERLAKEDYKDTLVLGLARGGVPVAYEVAQELHAPLDVLVVRKIGIPWNPELAMGALTLGTIILNRDMIHSLHIGDEEINMIIHQEEEILNQRLLAYRGHKKPPDLENKTVILVDDGLATGSTMKAAVLSVKTKHPLKIVVAVPVGPPETVHELEDMADEVICLYQPTSFM